MRHPHSIVGFLTLLLLFFNHGAAENWPRNETVVAHPSPTRQNPLDDYTQEAFDIAAILSQASLSTNDLELLELGQLIVDKSHEINVDPYVVLAVIQVESTFDPCARSHRGAKGLMQVMPHRILGWETVRREFAFSSHVFYDPHWNINFGLDYLGYLLQRFGCLETALTAYNAGPTRVASWLDKTGEAIHTDYCERVFRRYHALRPNDES